MIPLFWTFGNVSPGFQSQGGSLALADLGGARDTQSPSGSNYFHFHVVLRKIGVRACSDPQIHLWCNTCRPLGNQHGSRAFSMHIPADQNISLKSLWVTEVLRWCIKWRLFMRVVLYDNNFDIKSKME